MKYLMHELFSSLIILKLKFRIAERNRLPFETFPAIL